MNDITRTSKERVFEPCYCKRCRGVMPAPCKYQGKSWLQLLWLRVWCAMDGHGGITPLYGRSFQSGPNNLCKRCGATVRLV